MTKLRNSRTMQSKASILETLQRNMANLSDWLHWLIWHSCQLVSGILFHFCGPEALLKRKKRTRLKQFCCSNTFYQQASCSLCKFSVALITLQYVATHCPLRALTSHPSLARTFCNPNMILREFSSCLSLTHPQLCACITFQINHILYYSALEKRIVQEIYYYIFLKLVLLYNFKQSASYIKILSLVRFRS